MVINFPGFLSSLLTMLVGMVGIFLVIGLIALSVILMSKLFPAEKKQKADGKRIFRKKQQDDTEAGQQP